MLQRNIFRQPIENAWLINQFWGIFQVKTLFQNCGPYCIRGQIRLEVDKIICAAFSRGFYIKAPKSCRQCFFRDCFGGGVFGWGRGV